MSLLSIKRDHESRRTTHAETVELLTRTIHPEEMAKALIVSWHLATSQALFRKAEQEISHKLSTKKPLLVDLIDHAYTSNYLSRPRCYDLLLDLGMLPEVASAHLDIIEHARETELPPWHCDDCNHDVIGHLLCTCGKVAPWVLECMDKFFDLSANRSVIFYKCSTCNQVVRDADPCACRVEQTGQQSHYVPLGHSTEPLFES